MMPAKSSSVSLELHEPDAGAFKLFPLRATTIVAAAQDDRYATLLQRC
jgi:hypothetical protein